MSTPVTARCTTILILTGLVMASVPAADLDTGWAGSGIRSIAHPTQGVILRALLMRPDGRVLVAGDSEAGSIWGLTTDGRLDASFGIGGVVHLRAFPDDNSLDVIRTLAQAADDRIYVGGESHDGWHWNTLLFRLMADGSVDTDFSAPDDTLSGDRIRALRVDGANRPLMAGSLFIPTIPGGSSGNTRAGIARFTTSGAWDPSFGDTGRVNLHDTGFLRMDDLVIDGSGRIVAVGLTTSNRGFGIVRLTATGALDSTFNSNGLLFVSSGGISNGSDNYAQAVAIDGAGRIVAAGASGGQGAIIRVTAAGSLDSDFAGNGVLMLGSLLTEIVAIALDGSGRILVAGNNAQGDGVVARLTASGVVDSSYGDAGSVVISHADQTCTDLVMDAAGRVLLAGHRGYGTGSQGFVARIKAAPAGSAPNPAPAVDGPTVTNTPRPTWTWQSAGGSGTFRYKLGDSVMTVSATVTTATTFTPATDLGHDLHTLWVQEQALDGNWSVVGSHTVDVDLMPPSAPSWASITSPTTSATPTWNWNVTSWSGSNAIIAHRYRLNNAAIEGGTVVGNVGSFTPGTPLPLGTHTLYLQRQERSGNWSSVVSRSVVIWDGSTALAPTISVNSLDAILTEDGWFSNLGRPRFNWQSGGGNGTYRFAWNTADLSAAATTTGTFHQPADALDEGVQILYLQEQAADDSWGPLASLAITIDRTPPPAPVVEVVDTTTNPRPTWHWHATEDHLEYRVGTSSDYWNAGSWSPATSFTPAAPLPPGEHRLYVWARDRLGNVDEEDHGMASVLIIEALQQRSVRLTVSDDQGPRASTLWAIHNGGLHYHGDTLEHVIHDLDNEDDTRLRFTPPADAPAPDGSG